MVVQLLLLQLYNSRLLRSSSVFVCCTVPCRTLYERETLAQVSLLVRSVKRREKEPKIVVIWSVFVFASVVDPSRDHTARFSLPNFLRFLLLFLSWVHHDGNSLWLALSKVSNRKKRVSFCCYMPNSSTIASTLFSSVLSSMTQVGNVS